MTTKKAKAKAKAKARGRGRGEGTTGVPRFRYAPSPDDGEVGGIGGRGDRLGAGGEGYTGDLGVVVLELEVLPGAVGGFLEESLEGLELAEAELQG